VPSRSLPFVAFAGLAGLVGLVVGSAACSAPSPVKKLQASASEFEFIVVGSGAGGGPVAARLARAGKRVLLLEAGEDPGGSAKYQVPAMHALATEDAESAWWYFVEHGAPALDQKDSKYTKDGILYPRGSALGGSTAVNAMVTVLPSRSDWNRLAELTGDASYRANAMEKYYARVREWLTVEIPDPRLALSDAKVTNFLTAASIAHANGNGNSETAVNVAGASSNLAALLQADVNQSLLRGETTGVFRLPLATKSGHRNGPREFIVSTVQEGYPLTVRTGAFVTRVLWDERSKTARGVEYVQASHVYGASLAQETAPEDRAQAFASAEVILSAGAFNTPQLLTLSGVGPDAELARLGIAQVASVPGVGENLQDRYEAPVVSTFKAPLDVLANCKLSNDSSSESDPCYASWQAGQGVYRTPGFLASVLMRSSPELALADLQVFAVPTDARGYYPGYSKDSAAAKNSFTWLLLKAHTQNHDGTVTLKSADPFAKPRIQFHSYRERDPLSDPDLLAMVQGVKFVRSIESRMNLLSPNDKPREVWPGPERQTDGDLAEWIRRESWGHHACGSAKMGMESDANAVVDSEFKVRGVSHLRVVDASVFPEIPGTFIALPTFMMSEKAADVLLGKAAR
jgi:choline dehydrogenase